MRKTPSRETAMPGLRKLGVEQLEDRITPALVNAVADTTSSPNSAVVHITSIWDDDGDDKISNGDLMMVGSGVLIGNHAVLTAAHVVYQLEDGPGNVRFIDRGHADWVFVDPGRNGEFNRPFGEAEATNWWVPNQYALGDSNYDIAVLQLDRNVGAFAGTLEYGYLSKTGLVNFQDLNPLPTAIDMLGKLLPNGARETLGQLSDVVFTPANAAVTVGQSILSSVGLGLTGGFGRSGRLEVLGYPTQFVTDQYRQRSSDSPASDLPLLAYSDPFFLYADMRELWVAHGSSGGPLLASGVTINGQRKDNLVIGLVSGAKGSTLPPERAPGDGGVAYFTRLDADYLRFIQSALDDMDEPTDRPELVDAFGWAGDDSLIGREAVEGETISVSARVRNVGTAAATGVTVRFALSLDNRFSSGDILLGDVDIGTIDPFSTRTAFGQLTVPGNTAGETYYVVYKIDPDNTVAEYGTPLANYKTRPPAELRYRLHVGCRSWLWVRVSRSDHRDRYRRCGRHTCHLDLDQPWVRRCVLGRVAGRPDRGDTGRVPSCAAERAACAARAARADRAADGYTLTRDAPAPPVRRGVRPGRQ